MSCVHHTAVQVSGTQYVERGDIIRLECNCTGRPNPPHDVTWLKAGERLLADVARDVIITKNIETNMLVSVLVIGRSSEADAADYTCQSSNHDEATITVHVFNGESPFWVGRCSSIEMCHFSSVVR